MLSVLTSQSKKKQKEREELESIYIEEMNIIFEDEHK